MIEVDAAGPPTFYLTAGEVSYWFRVTDYGHLEHLYFGPRIPRQNPNPLAVRHTAQVGSTIAYEDGDMLYSLDNLALEYSGVQAGDYRESPVQLEGGDGPVATDFVYKEHRIGPAEFGQELPAARNPGPSVTVTLADRALGAELDLLYSVFPKANTIVRQARLRNVGEETLTVRRLASLMVDIPNNHFQVLNFSGAWIRETHAASRPLTPGTYSFGSLTGASSNRHNPGSLLHPANTTEERGIAYGFNLLYSGNHETSYELDSFGLVRVSSGIHPQGFAWPILPGDAFTAPQAALTVSADGLNGVSHNFHAFVRHHVQPERYLHRARPVTYNGWEALFFDFDENRQLRLAKRARELGAELFVVDDGWFEERGDDTAGLGNFKVDRKKFPRGLGLFAKKLNRLGLQFGLWLEPEMVSEKSDLFRAHPDWILRSPGSEPKKGRNQYVLDLGRVEVQDYLINKVGEVLDSADISYIKWDMNRHIADAYSPSAPNQGMVSHGYVRGLYRVLRELFDSRPNILLETCSSGGNRFDLGMLSVSAMIWASDDTDPIERLSIQRGLSYLYPLCSISNHVSNSPHQQTLRDTPLSTRFNVAAFGALGYEYDLDLLTQQEAQEIREQVRFYKEHRELFQWGTFDRLETARSNLTQWQVRSQDADLAVVGNFQSGIGAAPGVDRLRATRLHPHAPYLVESKPQRLMIDRLGALIHHVLPIRLNPRGTVMTTVSKYHSLKDAQESYTASGALLEQGIFLASQFMGSHYNTETRLLGDWGSTLYTISRVGAGGQNE